MNLKHKKIIKTICIILLMIVLFLPISSVFAEVTPTGDNTETAENIKAFFGWILKIGTGPLTAAIASLMNAIIVVLFVLLYFIFSPLSANFAFPFPDQIIFNKIPFFDPNFINPNSNVDSPVNLLEGLIRNLYNTGFVIAGAVFVIAAMIIGIKLAVSTIASEKAHYKQSLVTWITGLLLLFTTHFIMLGIFTINEEIVKEISIVTTEIKFTFQWTEVIPVVGNMITNLLNAVTGIISGITGLDIGAIGTYNVYGYSGLLIKFGAAAIGGDIVGSVICAILLGQTCAIIMMYLRRLFYSIILGMIAPLIVAADIIKKTL